MQTGLSRGGRQWVLRLACCPSLPPPPPGGEEQARWHHIMHWQPSS